MDVSLETIVLWAVPVVFAITLHEAAHGYVAKLFGDRTAEMLGRITLNPLKHIDPIGTILVPGMLLALAWVNPSPPLDGGRVLAGLLPGNASTMLSRLEPYGFFIILVLLALGLLDDLMRPLIRIAASVIARIIDL